MRADFHCQFQASSERSFPYCAQELCHTIYYSCKQKFVCQIDIDLH